jgi:hypothetical protein
MEAVMRGPLQCNRCKKPRDRHRDFERDEKGTLISRTCRFCRVEMHGRRGPDREFVRCQLVVRARPLVDGLPVEGLAATHVCGALVFRGREQQHLVEAHGVAGEVDGAFAKVPRDGETAA